MVLKYQHTTVVASKLKQENSKQDGSLRVAVSGRSGLRGGEGDARAEERRPPQVWAAAIQEIN